MKYFFIILAEFMIFVDSGVKDFKFHPNLPLGEYRVNFIAVHQCQSSIQKCSFQNNFFLFKTSRTTVQLRGNMTINRTLDDSLLLHLTMAVKDKIGGWQNNAYIYHSPMAFSSFKKILGAESKIFFNSFGVNDTMLQDSIKPGIYTTTKGYDISNYPSNTNFPKQLFYGTYKLNITFTEKSGSFLGCSIFVIEVKRPWEIE